MTTIGPPVAGSSDDRRFLLSTFAALTSTAAFLLAALGIVVVAAVEPGSSSVSAGPTTVAVALSELKFTPASLTAPAGAVKLDITNEGSSVHNVSVPALGKKSADIAAGGTATLDLGNLSAGTYEVLCEIPGHAEGGMKATLVVSGSGGGGTAAASGETAAGDHSGHGGADQDWAAIDKRMMDGMAQGLETHVKGGSTRGVGNQKLAPASVEADGTKVFKLTAAITDWEVSAGRTVKAWTYNGMVPGPWIRTEPNDKVRVIVENKLPVSTDVHWHGISTPFRMDGVSPLTQPPIAPGETFTYEWTNPDHTELGMYHAHAHGHEAIVNGMFAVLQVGDVPLPRGRSIANWTIPADFTPTYELPMVLNDAGVIGYSLNGKSFPATEPIKMKPGESLLLHYYNEGLAIHPMHLHRIPQIVVAKDGYPLAEPYIADTVNVAPGERYSVLIMPRESDVGAWAFHCHILTHAEGADGLFGMVTALMVGDPNEAG